MNISNKIEKYEINSQDLKFQILPSGDIFLISYKWDNISMYKATSLDGMMANIYLRLTIDGKLFSTRLLGINSPSDFYIGKNQMQYIGKFKGVEYQVDFQLEGLTWFWTVKISKIDFEGYVELFYGQDVSLNGPWANEAYVCQYLDHSINQIENGYHITTKQNQGNPLDLQQGTLTNNIAYATDGFQFFGNQYKLTNDINAMKQDKLPSECYQYELAYIALQTPKVKLDDNYRAVFYCHLTTNFNNKKEKFLSMEKLWDIYNNLPSIEQMQKVEKPALTINWQNTYPYVPMTKSELDSKFPERIFEEYENGKILSWFNKDNSHFVIGEKEEYIERPHGNIIATEGMKDIDFVSMASTNYIFGIFNSQVSIGNTQFSRMITNNKTPLNIMKVSGQRIFVKVNGEFYLLALPALYQMTINSSTWHYKIKDDFLIIEVAIAPEDTVLLLKVKSEKNYKYDFIISEQLIMGDTEFVHPIHIIVDNNKTTFTFDEKTESFRKYPDYAFQSELITEGKYQFFSDEFFYKDNKTRNNSLFSIKIDDTDSFIYVLYGKHNKFTDYEPSIEKMQKEYEDLQKERRSEFFLEINPDNPNYREIQKFNFLVPWYVHNASIHYSSPHGLEQYGGGAWGTRDISQGPVELFSAFNRFDLVKKAIIKVYERQFFENGDWPQWFMFDRFEKIQAQDSHGDIIVWPLYILGRYMLSTGDKDILKAIVPYTSLNSAEKVNPETIYDHVKKQIATLVHHFLPGTHLSSYGGGDWDDTLQPVNREATKYMVSSWTVALTIQALETFLIVCDDDDEIKTIVQAMKNDYQRYIIHNKVPAGFIEIKDGVKLIVHPNDNETNIKYRLLSFNQGIIAEIFDSENIPGYLDIIEKNLMHPDGVRLMDTTVKYQGGTPKRFIRAETATNFGREIGLQYVHAHIRYAEAMAKIGEADRLFEALKVINPILIKENVKNAITRQFNVYFSSSDGDFLNRYEADKNFDKLRNGEVNVKSGWRLYSSGPGIYLNQLITNFLGINSLQNELYIDPVLPVCLNGLKLHFRYKDYLLDITYEVTKPSGVKYVIINGKKIDCNTALLKYRSSGVIIPISYLKEMNQIKVVM